MKRVSEIAIVAITKNGVKLGRKLFSQLPCATLYYPEKFSYGDESESNIILIQEKVKLLIAQLFQSHQRIVMFIALGAVVRMVAPLLQDKKTDPAIVVVDEQGKHAISVLSGHLGGGNELTYLIAEKLRATPVITTASDVQNTIQVDLLGKEKGWQIECMNNVKDLSAFVVNGEKVAIVWESGENVFFDQHLGDHIVIGSSYNEVKQHTPKGFLYISHRLVALPKEKAVFYRPKVIVLGIGCNRGTKEAEIETVIIQTLNELQFSIRSVRAICSIDLKKDEIGLLKVAEKYGWETVFYSADELNKITIQQPSETVFRYTGAYGVSEPAAMLYSNVTELALVKNKSGNVTISVAVMNERVAEDE